MVSCFFFLTGSDIEGGNKIGEVVRVKSYALYARGAYFGHDYDPTVLEFISKSPDYISSDGEDVWVDYRIIGCPPIVDMIMPMIYLHVEGCTDFTIPAVITCTPEGIVEPGLKYCQEKEIWVPESEWSEEECGIDTLPPVQPLPEKETKTKIFIGAILFLGAIGYWHRTTTKKET
ncbi:hypothetical protein LCGC14_1023500 [marine sediment metagenome]|uniref:Uncharacterized protein n=1 Tax=marine sediment metagenome TaxID=412755 RepID=A0A0F9NID0_9ZZZZ